VGTGGAGPVIDSTTFRVLSDARSVIVTGKVTLPTKLLQGRWGGCRRDANTM
jgi:hypothetical protein